jgi:hypothetical protein
MAMAGKSAGGQDLKFEIREFKADRKGNESQKKTAKLLIGTK